MNKPEVKFTELVEFLSHGKSTSAILSGVSGHPYLGAPHGNVYTSEVLSVNKDKTRIETRNTIYIKSDG